MDPSWDWDHQIPLMESPFVTIRIESPRRRCGLESTQPIPASLRAAALLSFEGEKVPCEDTVGQHVFLLAKNFYRMGPPVEHA